MVKNLMLPRTAARFATDAKELRNSAQSDRRLSAAHDETAKIAVASLN